MIKYLSQWIKHNVAIMSDRSFPNNPVELKVSMILIVIISFILHNRAKKVLSHFTECLESAYGVRKVKDNCRFQTAHVQSVSAVTETLSDIDGYERATAFISCKTSIAFISEGTFMQLI